MYRFGRPADRTAQFGIRGRSIQRWSLRTPGEDCVQFSVNMKRGPVAMLGFTELIKKFKYMITISDYTTTIVDVSGMPRSFYHHPRHPAEDEDEYTPSDHFKVAHLAIPALSFTNGRSE